MPKTLVFNILKSFKVLSQNRILITDDEDFCLEAMKVMLKLIGADIEYKVDMCINGQEQLTRIMESYECGFSYSIILTDFNMPIMNGIESTRRIREYFETNNI